MNYLVFFLLLLALSTHLFKCFFVWSRFGSYLLWFLRKLLGAFASVCSLWLVFFLPGFRSLIPHLILFGEFYLGSMKHRLKDLSWYLGAFYRFLGSVLSANPSVFCTNCRLRSLISTSTLLRSTSRFRAGGGTSVFCNDPFPLAVVSECLLTAKIWQVLQRCLGSRWPFETVCALVPLVQTFFLPHLCISSRHGIFLLFFRLVVLSTSHVL